MLSDGLSPTERQIYRTYVEHRGQSAADRWLRSYLTKRGTPPPVAPEAAAKTVKAPPHAHKAGATARWHQNALEELLQRSRGRNIRGQEAIDLAAAIIGEAWRKKLGSAYPLVLLVVKGALESGRRPGDEDGNTYHCFTTNPSLGVLCALLKDRDESFNEKTIRRWLDPDARHASALRCWLGWRHWMTDSLLEYRQGVNPKTGKVYKTGQSRGPVVGGTLFRVRLTPLKEVKEEQLRACTKERPSVIQPLKPELERAWRDLEVDRHQGRTWTLSPNCIPLEEVDVHIDKERTKDIKGGPLCYLETCKTDELTPNNLINQNYLYPDIASLEGAARLRGDVERTALWLMRCVEGEVKEARRLELLNRYRHAVWVAYKAHRYGQTREGFELLLLAKNLAFELRQTPNHSIKDVGAYVWSVVERRGFAELRRDYSYQKGRYLRVFGSGVARGLGLMA